MPINKKINNRRLWIHKFKPCSASCEKVSELQMNTLIHIGQHKTGTTSIQKYLNRNRDCLLQHKIYVPIFPNTNHWKLNVYSLDDERISTMKKILKKSEISKIKQTLKKDVETIYKDAHAQNCNQIIWSNEGLYLLNSLKEYGRLTSLFQKLSNQIEIVCCFREIDSYKKSFFTQLGGDVNYIDKNSCHYFGEDSYLFNYDAKRKLLSECYDKCTFFDYNSTDNVKNFLTNTKLPECGKTNNFRYNET